MSDRPAPVYRVHIGPADVGRRVALRRVLDDGRSGLGDVLGDLVAWADGALTVRTRNGDVRVAEEHLVAARLIPPPPQRRAPRAGG